MSAVLLDRLSPADCLEENLQVGDYVLAIDGVIRDVVETAEAGIAVPPGDAAAMAKAITEMASHPETSKAMGLAGRKYIEDHLNRRELADKLALVLTNMRGLHG